MIPRLRPDGTLPPGMHQATIDEVLAAYPPLNQQRQILNDSLRRATEELRKLDPSLTIYLDGSYVTSKAEPNDVNLLIISTQFDALDVVAYLNQACPVEAVSLGIYVELRLPNTIMDFFTTTRAGHPKGIIVLV